MSAELVVNYFRLAAAQCGRIHGLTPAARYAGRLLRPPPAGCACWARNRRLAAIRSAACGAWRRRGFWRPLLRPSWQLRRDARCHRGRRNWLPPGRDSPRHSPTAPSLLPTAARIALPWSAIGPAAKSVRLMPSANCLPLTAPRAAPSTLSLYAFPARPSTCNVYWLSCKIPGNSGSTAGLVGDRKRSRFVKAVE